MFGMIKLRSVLLVCILYPRGYAEQGPLYHSKWKTEKVYEPNWSDLDTRPSPDWYDTAKIGIFVHWGVYSVPAFVDEWFWYRLGRGDTNITEFMTKNYPTNFTYKEFAPMLTGEFFDSDEWARLFLKAGAKYVVFTTKHHDGFSLFPSNLSNGWDSVNIGPKIDVVKEVSESVVNHGMYFGAYYSLMEWNHPQYEADKADNFQLIDDSKSFPVVKLLPDIKQLINDYKPSILWADGDFDAVDTYWKSTEILAWLYNESPVKNEIVVNDRWGLGTACKHGDFYNCEDRYHPKTLMKHKWENAFNLDKISWSYRRNINVLDILSIEQVLTKIVSSVSCGGNVLINVGPTKEGTIPPIFQERLLQLGAWLEINGEAIYHTSPWLRQNDTLNPDVWYTCKKFNTVANHNPVQKPKQTDQITSIYVIFLKWPMDNNLELKSLAKHLRKGNQVIELLDPGNFSSLPWDIVKRKVIVKLPYIQNVSSKSAWALRVSNRY